MSLPGGLLHRQIPQPQDICNQGLKEGGTHWNAVPGPTNLRGQSSGARKNRQIWQNTCSSLPWLLADPTPPSAVPQSHALHTPVLIPPALLVPDPFVTQFSSGCELHPNGTLRPFCDAGLNGEDFISLNVDMGTWVTRSGDKLALDTRDILNYNKVVIIMLQFLLRTTCVNEIRTFVQFGKETLEREAPPPAGTPSSILVVCRVTGFYPRPIRVSWLQDGEEVAPGWRLNSTGILPNADLTYQLRSSLAVEPGDGHSYACRVEHVSLGGHSLLIPWSRSGAAVLVWWNRRR
uniref:Ig-like domain-containing protein n=1 Tax=Pelusios castaneus TaxID=367368 RepID=A0A8C8RE40_9SAUR